MEQSVGKPSETSLSKSAQKGDYNLASLTSQSLIEHLNIITQGPKP